MKNLIASGICVAFAGALGIAAPVLADDHKQQSTVTGDANWKAQSPEIVERNNRGRVTKVRIDGQVIDVCMNSEQDSCINPRAAGLGFGNRPLMYWPGQPASSM
ncbi:hypothetical protein [Erythrobacter sp.]|uniref:hypothetical protein n=1 Tax=Erythrobacter sp. TaxID=1042 RepID=UPI002EC67652|nr:hypothetical protein [Erythrobacter sp.]